MRALIITSEVENNIKSLMEYAHKNVLARALLERLSAGFDPKDVRTRPPQTNVIAQDFTMDIPLGYRVTYTVEDQPIGLCKHLSVSVPKRGKSPHPLAVQEIMKLFKFDRPLEQCKIWTEEYEKGFTAVNVVEPVMQ